VNLPVTPGIEPMEAETAARLPEGEDWQYEPKWDGFRCLAFRDGDEVSMQSKAGQPLARYFPEVQEALLELKAKRFVLDGELFVSAGGRLHFDHLLQRIHPAESRIRKLAAQTPATYAIFDLLVDERGKSWMDQPLVTRREALTKFAASHLNGRTGIVLSPFTSSYDEAKTWFEQMAGDLDGVIAKRTSAPYLPGERGVMLKIKNLRTADCVVGGFRYGSTGTRQVGSLLLGLYDSDGLLHHVGFTSSLPARDKAELTHKLEALVEPPGFTGKAPGGPSRWSRRKSSEWQPLRPVLVVEVQYDHFSGGRFRHGTRLLRWRPDKKPAQCTLQQVEREARSPLDLLTK
jgi:ATP-dependent DNA ligase